MSQGITYYKLISRYDSDVTKKCALDPYEVDDNFYTLEGRDIKSVEKAGNDLIITLYNGSTLTATGVTEANAITDLSYDQQNGILTFVQNGKTYTLEGFATTVNDSVAISTDDTLHGDGTIGKPIGISDIAKTGQYKPVDSIIRLCECEKLPPKDHLLPGFRFLTEEEVSDYGYLYNYRGVKAIACDLSDAKSKWRVPSKDDWDGMLNAVEPCEDDRNHNVYTDNRNLGKWAGRMLKSVDLWKPVKNECDEYYECDDCDCKETNGWMQDVDDNDSSVSDGGKSSPCYSKYCGEYGNIHYRCKKDVSGIDKYGFRVTPAGYTDDGKNYGYFKERAAFWTSKNNKCSTAYAKRFEYDKATVHQEIIAGQCYLSLRLVKDYDGSNFNEREDILGVPYSCVLMPSQTKGKQIWTSVNVSFANKQYNPLVPNGGRGLSSTTHYFINEWTGKKWVRNELKEGESVVVLHAPKHRESLEYRVVNGNLETVSDEVFRHTMEAIKPKLDGLTESLLAEKGRAKEAEAELSESIEALTERVATLEENTANADSEIHELEERMDSAEANIKDLQESLADTKTDVENLQNDLATETANREDADDALSASIQTETDERKAADDALEEKFNDYVPWTDIATDENPGRKAIVLANHDNILGTDTNGDTYNLAMVSKWDVADFGSSKLHMNLNSSDRVTVNDEQESLAYMSDLEQASGDINGSIEDLKNRLEQEISDRKEGDEELDEHLTDVEGKLPTQDGTEFNETTGEVTIKSVAGTNDITFKIDFNFGEF